MMDLYLLRYFLAVVETGSFTRAADRTFVTQPTLSAGIKKLEDQLGHILFERTNRRVFLTDAGTRFLPRAKAILHECNLAVQALEKGLSIPILRLGVLTTISAEKVGQMLAHYRKTEPNIAIEVVDGTEQELANRLDDRSLDFALSIYRGQDENEAIPLMEEGYLFILSKDNPFEDEQILQAQDLAGGNMIVRSRCEVLSETSRYFTDQNIRPRLAYRTPNDSRAIAMVAGGIGGTVVPESLVGEIVQPFKLRGFDYKRTLGLFRPRFDLLGESIEIANRFEEHVRQFWTAGLMDLSYDVTET